MPGKLPRPKKKSPAQRGHAQLPGPVDTRTPKQRAEAHIETATHRAQVTDDRAKVAKKKPRSVAEDLAWDIVKVTSRAHVQDLKQKEKDRKFRTKR